jgi:hypothetical protein
VLGVQREVVASIAAELKATVNPDMAGQPATEQPPSRPVSDLSCSRWWWP